MQFWALVFDSFRESLDRKIFWVMLLISLAVAGGMFCFSFEPNKVSILFGTWEIDTDVFTIGGKLRKDFIALIVVDLIMDTVLGWVGVILALIATAGFMPSLMQRGTIDVMLSKPIARWQLFLGKYMGSMVFVGFHATVFVGLTFLVCGMRWGVWLPGYLLSIPLVVLLFSYVYCVSVLVAIPTRSSIAAVLVTLGAWVFFAGVQITDDQFAANPSWQEYRTAYNASRVARWVLPNTSDITIKAKQWARAASSSELFAYEDPDSQETLKWAERVERDRAAIPAYYTIGSSLAFEAVVVLIAMWLFSRRDY